MRSLNTLSLWSKDIKIRALSVCPRSALQNYPLSEHPKVYKTEQKGSLDIPVLTFTKGAAGLCPAVYSGSLFGVKTGSVFSQTPLGPEHSRGDQIAQVTGISQAEAFPQAP